jgi:hypothetical protein
MTAFTPVSGRSVPTPGIDERDFVNYFRGRVTLVYRVFRRVGGYSLNLGIRFDKLKVLTESER